MVLLSPTNTPTLRYRAWTFHSYSAVQEICSHRRKCILTTRFYFVLHSHLLSGVPNILFHLQPSIYIYLFINALLTSGNAFRLPHSIAFGCSIRPFLDLFHSWLYIYIPFFQFFRGRLRFLLPSGFQLIINFGDRVGSILSTCPYQMSCFS